MAAKLERVDSVVVGHFNPHIISPEWLLQHKVVDKVALVKMRVKIADRRAAFNFSIAGLTWRVDDSRLVVEGGPDDNPAAMISRVVEILLHTPLTAIGNNFRYSCPHADWGGGAPRLGTLGTKELGQWGDVKSVGWHGSVMREGGDLVHIEVTEDETTLRVSFNFHRAVKDLAGIKQAAERFSADRDMSRTLLGVLVAAKAQA